VIVKLSDPRTPINLRQQGNQIMVDFGGTELPQHLQRRFDVTDFATPVASIDAVRSGSGTQLVITAAGDFEQLAYQADDQYVVELQPQRAAKLQVDQRPVYTGERMSLVFQDIDTRAVLQMLSDTSGQNIIVTDSVTGSLTLRLQNVPWDQALDVVMRLKGLAKRQEGNVIIVAPAEEVAAREKAELEARKDIQDLAPLRTEYLQVNYAKAEDIAALIRAQGGPSGGGAGGKSLLSSRGSVTLDARTNTLLIQDTSDSIASIRQLVATLDIPVRQVLIEARIVVVSSDFTRDLGVRAGFTAITDNGNTGLYSTTGTAAGNDTILGSALDNLAAGGGPLPAGADRLLGRQSLQREPAGRQPGRQPGADGAGVGLHRGPRAFGRTVRGQGRGDLLAAHHRRQPAGSDDRAGYGDSLPGSGVERRRDDPVQEGGAVPQGHAADYPGQPADS
jgi:type IV pilus assembly protein PilQ